jgi:peptidyl-prolyl cis-trans isomerase B (cyclophilin B)
MPGKETVVTLKTVQGAIAIRFFPEDAPEHVKNFVEHSKSGLYKGCAFHRVIPGFMIQGGDPNTKEGASGAPGTGGYGYKGPGTNIPAEFNERQHKRGILSAARSQDPDSAGSQFFVVQSDSFFLDNNYTVFGEAISGLDIVDKIVNIDRDGSDKPLEDQRIQDVLVEEWDTEKVEAALKARVE